MRLYFILFNIVLYYTTYIIYIYIYNIKKLTIRYGYRSSYIQYIYVRTLSIDAFEWHCGLHGKFIVKDHMIFN